MNVSTHSENALSKEIYLFEMLRFCIILLLFVMFTIVICFIICHGGVSFIWNHSLGLISIGLLRGLRRKPFFITTFVALFCIGVDVYFFFGKLPEEYAFDFKFLLERPLLSTVDGKKKRQKYVALI